MGIFNGCTTEWGAPSSGWGAQYGGISSRSDCDSFPEALQAGCYWRFDWFEGSDNPTVSFTQVACPAAITKNTGCIRADDTSEAAAAVPSGSTVVAVVASSTTEAVIASSTHASDPVATTEAASDLVATSTDAGEVATTSEDSDLTPTPASSADPATTNPVDDGVCEL